MRKVISLSEIVELLELEEGWDEVCATAQANYNEATCSLAVKLGSFVRPVDLRTAERHATPAWLPQSDTVRETVPLDEAVALARDIFHRWVKKVRQSIPSSVNLATLRSPNRGRARSSASASISMPAEPRRLPLAVADIISAAEWYDDQQPGLGDEFVAEVDAVIKSLPLNPRAHAIRFADVRCNRLKRFNKYGLLLYLAGGGSRVQRVSRQSAAAPKEAETWLRFSQSAF